jgi:hypothetical protein
LWVFHTWLYTCTPEIRKVVLWKVNCHIYIDNFHYNNIFILHVLAVLIVMYTSVHKWYMALLIYPMPQMPSWKVNQFSGSQDIPHNFWYLNVHYRICSSLPPVPTLSQINATWHN